MRDDERGGRSAPGLERDARPIEDTNTTQDAELSRRELLKIVGATSALVATHMMLPREWAHPIVDVGTLPAHAQTSGTDAGTSGGTDAGVAGFTLRAVRNSDGTVTLTWVTPSGIDSIEIYRTAEGKSEERIAVADTVAGTMIDYASPTSALTYRGAISGGTATASVAGAQ